MTIGEKIKYKRKELRLTQDDLAGPTLSTAMISLIERDLTNPSLKSLEYIASKIGVSVNFLLDQEEDESTRSTDFEGVIDLVKGFIHANRHSEAKKLLEQYNIVDVPLKYSAYFYRLSSEVDVFYKDYDAAIKKLEESFLYLSSSEINDYIESHKELSTCYRKVGNFQESITNALNGLILIKSNYYTKDPFVKLELLYNLAHCYCRLDEFDKGINIINEALSYMKVTECYYYEDRFYMLKGLAHLYMTNFNDGIEATLTAVTLLEKSDNEKKETYLAGCYSNLGILYREIGENDTSVNYLEKGIELSTKEGDEMDLMNSHFELSKSLLAMRNFEKAEKLCEDNLNSSLNSTPLGVKILLLLTQIKFQQEFYQESLVHLEIAESISLELEDQELIANVYYLKAQILEKTGHLKQAYKYLLTSQKIFINLKVQYNNLNFI